jgi:hypothetical protein
MAKTSGMDPVALSILNYMDEADDARKKRMDANQENFDCYHLRADWSHKERGQSKEFLGKQQSAVDQISSFLQQGLIDVKKWFEVQMNEGVVAREITPDVLQSLMKEEMDRIGPAEFVSDSVKLGLLGSLIICKVHGERVRKSVFEVDQQESEEGVRLNRRDKFKWQLKLDLLRQEDYYPDPTGNGLYEIQTIDMDWFQLLQIAEANPDIYDVKMVKSLTDSAETEQEHNKARETDQVNPMDSHRKRVRLIECWGTILDPFDNTVLHENAVCVIEEGGKVISAPRSNPFWHGESPFVVSPLARVPHSVWHRAMMDAPTKHNTAQNELYNLMVDGAMMSAFGIKQVREHWLDDPSQVADGIPAGTTLSINQQCPPGQKALERVDTGANQSETFNMFNIIDREFQQSSLTNDVRMGILPERNVKATEIVASSQTITGIFNGIVKLLETKYLGEVLRKGSLAMMQNLDDFSSPKIKDVLGEQVAIKVGSLSQEERFAQVANGCKFKVFGLSSIMNKIQDFRKITTLLQTIAGSPDLVKEFTQSFSFTKLMGEIMKSLDIDEEKIALDDQERARLEQERQQAQQLAALEAQGKGGGEGQPDGMSQVPSASNIPQNGGQLPAEIQPGSFEGS